MIPKLAATDHTAYKDWSQAFRQQLKDASQKLFETLTEEKLDRAALRTTLKAVESEMTTVDEARKVLPANLAASFEKMIETTVKTAVRHMANARQKLEA